MRAGIRKSVWSASPRRAVVAVEEAVAPVVVGLGAAVPVVDAVDAEAVVVPPPPLREGPAAPLERGIGSPPCLCVPCMFDL